MWGQPPKPALSGAEGAVRRAKLDSHYPGGSPSVVDFGGADFGGAGFWAAQDFGWSSAFSAAITDGKLFGFSR